MPVRILIGWLVLISIAALAGLIQSRWTDGVRADRDELMRARGARTGPSSEWSRVIVGRPSGADAADIELELPPAFDDLPPERGMDPDGIVPDPAPLPPEPEARVWQIVIQPGDVLGKLCAKAYGKGTPGIVAAVARYNGIADPNRLSVGDRVLLPPYEDLRTESGEPLTPLR